MVVLNALQENASRRDVIKGTLKAGAYAAPIIAAGAIPFAVGAVTGPTATPGPAPTATTGPVARISLSPNPVALGSPLTVTGTGFTPNSVVYRIVQKLNAAGAPIGNFSSLALTVDGNGNFSNTVNTLSNIITSSGGAGTYLVTISNADPFAVGVPVAGSNFFLASATFTLTVPAGTMLAPAPNGNVREG